MDGISHYSLGADFLNKAIVLEKLYIVAMLGFIRSVRGEQWF